MKCAEFHRQYNRHANGDVQVGELPPWMHVQGRVAWYVAQGPYSQLSDMWQVFMGKVQGSKVPVLGPPGDVYVCDPEDHEADAQRTLITILWAPMKA